jgi:hypothetical protein
MKVASTAALLLLVTSQAEAECAWVSWRHMSTDNPAAPISGVWEPVESFTSKGECDKLTELMSKGMKPASTDKSGHRYFTELLCLPDTVDPRGPKAK